MNLKDFLKNIGIAVNDFRLIENSFVHASYANENDNFEENFEEIYFLHSILKKDFLAISLIHTLLFRFF